MESRFIKCKRGIGKTILSNSPFGEDQLSIRLHDKEPIFLRLTKDDISYFQVVDAGLYVILEKPTTYHRKSISDFSDDDIGPFLKSPAVSPYSAVIDTDYNIPLIFIDSSDVINLEEFSKLVEIDITSLTLKETLTDK